MQLTNTKKIIITIIIKNILYQDLIQNPFLAMDFSKSFNEYFMATSLNGLSG